MKILVTGASGFTGIHFVQGAKYAGHEVVSLDADLTDRETVMRQVLHASPEAVVHLAAISFVGHADANDFYNVNVIGTLNLLDALVALDVAPARILLASSANIYGNCQQSPIPETQSPAPMNHYAMSKLAMEYMAKNYIDRLAIFFVRPFNYIGVGQAESFIVPKLVSHFARKANVVELGNIDVEREFNDVRYVCEIYLRLLEKSVVGEIYNICSGKPITLKAMIDLLSEISGHTLTVKVNPSFVRANEVHRLCGDPKKLHGVVGDIPRIPLESTLEWMLK